MFNFMKRFQADYPLFRDFFPYDDFNTVQQDCYDPIVRGDTNVVVCAPTSSGKTVLFQWAIIKQSSKGPLKCLYLAPVKSLCHQKFAYWSKKFKGKLSVAEITGDSSQESQGEGDLTIATPEKMDAFSRKNLSFLKQVNLLLVDEIHMLNVENRGATLEAVISRIISLSNPRVVAVSATIPNIGEVGEWLKVPPGSVRVFGAEHRPVKISKVVLGFNSSTNPFTFQKMLNYKLMEVIRNYSCGKGALVFCQTQKGTEMACQQLISDMHHREFIEDDNSLLSLIQASKRISNTSLQLMIPQGVAFHNAGLSTQDRSVVEKLFLDSHIRVLCTTSTLSLGVNLPARLVVVKSTQCYKGAGKGYMEYSQIELDQMMGRAGRPPFEKEGTVVIMTERKNYNKYVNSGKLEVLQSHLYGSLSEHINAEIAIRSIESMGDVTRYFHNSFCYVRMKSSPSSYGIKNPQCLDQQVARVCRESVEKLDSHNLISYYPSTQKIVPCQLGVNVARNSIQIETITAILSRLPITSEREYLELLCSSEEVKSYRNKIDERKLLKELNQGNKYALKQSISTPDKKAFVLLQACLDGRFIENWELRKQANDLIFFMKRLAYCLKGACSDRKYFWGYFWSCCFHKWLGLGFWSRNEQMVMRQFEALNKKWKQISTKGFKSLSQMLANIHMLDSICQTKGELGQGLEIEVSNLKESIKISLSGSGSEKQLVVMFTGSFRQAFTQVCVFLGVVGDQKLTVVRHLSKNDKCATINLQHTKSYYLAILKSGFVGFDQFYYIEESGAIKREQIESLAACSGKAKKKDKKSTTCDTRLTKDEQADLSVPEQQNNRQSQSIIKPTKLNLAKKEKMNPRLQSSIKILGRPSRKRNSEPLEMAEPTWKRNNYVPLNQFECWKPGFPSFKEEHDERATLHPKKLLFKEESSKAKDKLIVSSKPQLSVGEKNGSNEESRCQYLGDVYDYFYNLFD